MTKSIIATYPLTNVSGLAIYAINSDSVLVGLNDDEPEELEIVYNEAGQAGFEWGGFVPLDECVRVQVNS